MIKLKKISLGVMLSLGAMSASAVEVTKDFDVGIYGNAGYKDFKNMDLDSYYTSNNIYGEMQFDKFKIMVDVHGQFDQINLQNDESKDVENYDLYQGYLTYKFNKSHMFKVGRIGGLDYKGQNPLDIKSQMLDSTSPIKVFGQSDYEHVDGAMYKHSLALNKGKFEAIFYGGKAFSLGQGENEYEGEKYTAILSFHKNGHRFLTGMDRGEYSATEDSSSQEVQDLEYENIYFTYQFENKSFFADSTYVISNYDDNSIVSDTKIIDAKIGTKMNGFKPFFGFNSLEIESSVIETITYGIRYDYKNVGLILSKSDVSGDTNDEVTLHGLEFDSAVSKIDEEIYSAKLIYNF